MRLSLLGGFLLRAIGWLLVCTPLWYMVSRFAATPVAWLAGLVSDTVMPGWTRGVEQEGTTLTLLTALRVMGLPGSPPDRVAVLSPSADFLVYGYGLPLLCALLLAARARRPWRKMLIGALALLPFQTWGVCFDWLKQIALTYGSQAGFSPLSTGLVAWAYQFGILVLPTLAPVALWIALDRRFLSTMVVEAALEHAPPQQAAPAAASTSDDHTAAADAAAVARAAAPL
ncbi:MAG: exosortase H-associated membrane protein, partial [Burkholderiaceae bacterium]